MKEQDSADFWAPLKIVALYVLLGGLWILFSDRLASALFAHDVDLLVDVQLVKGWFYVLVTAIMLYFLIRASLRATRRSARALQESERRYRSLFEGVPVGLYRTSPNGRVLEVNPALVEILGYADRASLLALPTIDVSMRPEVGARWQQLMERDGIVRNFEFEFRRPDGQIIWVRHSARAIRDAQGDIQYYEGAIEDVTAWKKTADALQQSELKYRTLVEQSLQGILILGAELNVLFANPALAEILDLTVAEVYALSVRDLRALIHPQDRRAVFRRFQDSLAGQAVGSRYEFRILRDDGAVHWVEMLSNRIAYQGKRAIQAIVLDITRRKEAEQALKRYAKQLEALREVGLEIAAQLDIDALLHSIVSHAVQLLDGTAGGLYKYRADEDVLEWTMPVGPNPVPLGARLERGEGLSGKVWEAEKPIIVENYQSWTGRASIYEDLNIRAVVGVPIMYGGEFLGVLNVLGETPDAFAQEDAELLRLFAAQAGSAIHNAQLYEDLRRHSDELAAALSHLRELDALKDEFIQNVSHELRTPLALILGYVTMLAEGDLGPLSPAQQEPISIIARRSQMLSDLVEDITLILEAETNPPQAEPLLLQELVRDAVADFRAVADQSNLRLEVECVENLPPVLCSRKHQRRVLDNLIGNAIKFTPSGGQITLRVYPSGGGAVLEVSDTGIGIPPQEQARIFERFYQVDGSAKRRYGGVGLGLALVKEIIEACGGRVWVESTPGEGTTFGIWLPVEDPARLPHREEA